MKNSVLAVLCLLGTMSAYSAVAAESASAAASNTKANAALSATPALSSDAAPTNVATSEVKMEQRQLLLADVASYTATGDVEKLKVALAAAIDAGVTGNELRDGLEQLYAYCGFPRSLTALGVLLQLVNERNAAGNPVNMGREATPLPADANFHTMGTEVQTRIAGGPVKGPLFDFSPNIDRYLKDHLFGAIFSSDLLSDTDREVLTVAALASLPAPSQLRSHIGISLNVGWTPEQLQVLAKHLETLLGRAAGADVPKALSEVVASRAK